MAHDAVSRNGTPPLPPTPRIEPEDPDAIRVGAGGRLHVPREDFDTGLDDGAEMDLVSGQPLKVRRPDRHEWVIIHRDSELTTRLLVHKTGADGIEVEYYYVADPALRGPVHDELKAVRVFIFYSLKTKTFGLWVVKVSPGNSWYESQHQLFKRPASFFAANTIRIVSVRTHSRYRVMHKPSPVAPVTWPAESTSDLLGEALGTAHFITSADHPVYRELIDGEELD